MARKIRPSFGLEQMEDEIFFTTAALKADPDAADLAAQTADWLAMVDVARAEDRAARLAVAETDAARAVANDRLDRACVAFGDELLLAAGKDRSSARFTQFFALPASRFVAQALSKQVAKVRGWLGSSDAVLERHRAALEATSNAVLEAIERTGAIAVVRGKASIARERLADDLTRERDGLYDALRARGRERGLPRDWADGFFRTERRSPAAEVEAPAETEA